MIGQIDINYIRKRPSKLWNRIVSYLFFEGRPVTTKGQWINPFVLTMLNFEKKFPLLKRIEKPIFIVGTGRSGTTVLGIVLSMHSDVGFLNEPKALWHAIFPYEDLIGSYDRGHALYRMDASRATPEVVQAAHRLYGVYLTATFSRRIVDKYPEQVFRVPFLRKVFPDAKFLFLVRNGWDTCYSIDQWSERLGQEHQGETHDWWGVDNRKWRFLMDQVASCDPDFKDKLSEIYSLTSHTDKAVTEWVLTMREGSQLCREYPESVLMVRYESLVQSPEQELVRIQNFCELAYDPKFQLYGEMTLSPGPARKPFPVHEAIREEFLSTMADLGY